MEKKQGNNLITKYGSESMDMHVPVPERKISSSGLGIRIISLFECLCTGKKRDFGYRVFIFAFTFLIYMGFHLARRPITIVKSVLHRNCSALEGSIIPAAPILPANISNTTGIIWCQWPPFDQPDYNALLGSLDYAFLIAYAMGMFLSGHIADRVNIRYFLAFGQIASGLFTIGFGLGYFLNIHSLVFYIFMQAFAGLFSSVGWPCVLACMANWYGKGKRGLIMGAWNSHTSVGNIVGALIAGIWVTHAWGWSFVVPGIIIASIGILTFLFLVPSEQKTIFENVTTGMAGSVTEPVIPVPRDVLKRNESSSRQTDVEEYVENNPSDTTPLVETEQGWHHKDKPITFCRALQIPGVIEFSLCLFFAKLVSYTFLYWLPNYIDRFGFDADSAGNLATLFDVGGVIGGIVVGLVSDVISGRAVTCFVTTLLATPLLYVTYLFLNEDLGRDIGLLLVSGAFVNGPYALITTAVAADLGTHPSLQANAKALATVTSIIDGTGSIGAAIGPALTGLLRNNYPWESVFYMLMVANGLSMLFLLRLVWKEVYVWILQRRYGV